MSWCVAAIGAADMGWPWWLAATVCEAARCCALWDLFFQSPPMSSACSIPVRKPGGVSSACTTKIACCRCAPTTGTGLQLLYHPRLVRDEIISCCYISFLLLFVLITNYIWLVRRYVHSTSVLQMHLEKIHGPLRNKLNKPSYFEDFVSYVIKQ
jgi:hypothetical protein